MRVSVDDRHRSNPLSSHSYEKTQSLTHTRLLLRLTRMEEGCCVQITFNDLFAGRCGAKLKLGVVRLKPPV